MKRFTLGLAATLALALPAAAQAAETVQVNFNSTTPIPANNDFQAKLFALGYTDYASLGASLILSGPAMISFEFLGSESGFDDTFSVPDLLSVTEQTLFIDRFANPIFLGSGPFAGGSLKNILNFSSNFGGPATVGDDGFGIFLQRGQQSGSDVTTFYIGYDDQITNIDDNHDDFIVRATVSSPVPEPATWALLLFGFGVAGMSMRARSRRVNTRVSFV